MLRHFMPQRILLTIIAMILCVTGDLYTLA